MSDPVNKTFEDVLSLFGERATEKRMKDVPAKVLTYNATAQTVDVQPLVLVRKNGVNRPLPIAQQVQVRWPAGSTWSIVGDLAPGDFGWLVPAGADISAWKMQGTEQDPTALQRTGKLGDVRFEPGSQPVSTPLAADAWKVGSLVIKAAQLLLGDSTATSFVALATIVDSIVLTIQTVFDAHVHADPVTGFTGPSVTPAGAPLLIGTQPKTEATKVKAI